MRTTVSVRWQTVIPHEAREALEIKPGERLDWEIRPGCLVVYPVPDDPIEASRRAFGELGISITNEELLEARREERTLEPVDPLPTDPIEAARGMFKGSGLTDMLLEERRKERERERAEELGIG